MNVVAIEKEKKNVSGYGVYLQCEDEGELARTMQFVDDVKKPESEKEFEIITFGLDETGAASGMVKLEPKGKDELSAEATIDINIPTKKRKYTKKAKVVSPTKDNINGSFGWSEEQVILLKRHFGTMKMPELSRIIGKKIGTIYSKAQSMGLKTRLAKKRSETLSAKINLDAKKVCFDPLADKEVIVAVEEATGQRNKRVYPSKHMKIDLNKDNDYMQRTKEEYVEVSAPKLTKRCDCGQLITHNNDDIALCDDCLTGEGVERS